MTGPYFRPKTKLKFNEVKQEGYYRIKWDNRGDDEEICYFKQLGDILVMTRLEDREHDSSDGVDHSYFEGPIVMYYTQEEWDEIG